LSASWQLQTWGGEMAIGRAEPTVSTSSFLLGQRPFSASSSWNTAIERNAIYSKVTWPGSSRYGVSWSSYSPAIYVATDADPSVAVTHPPSWGYPGGTRYVRIPLKANGAPGTDGELLVIEGEIAHNFWQFNRLNAGVAMARAYAAANVANGSGWGRASPFRAAGIVATGSSQLAGLLVQAETDQGEIEHALQIAIDSSFARPGHVGEAISGDGKSPTGLVQQGERLGIPPGTPMPRGLSPLGEKVFRALQRYGAFVIDVAGDVTNLRAQANAYDAATIVALNRDVTRFMPMLQRIEARDPAR
jgi:hypothetical protein